MKTLERLRLQKAKAVDRMTELNAVAARESRDLSETEKVEYAAKKTEAETLAAEIAEIEALTTKPAPEPTPTPAPAPAPTPAPDPEALRKQGKEEERVRVTTIRERLAAAKLPAETTQALEKDLIDSGATTELAATRIFAAMAARDAALPDTRTGLAVGRGDLLTQVETLSTQIAERSGVSKHKATVMAINANPKLYDQYLKLNPAQRAADQ